MMQSKKRKIVRMTKRPYTVVLACWDEPQHMWMGNFDYEADAINMFRMMQAIEVRSTVEMRVPGGEWCLTLYKHSPESTVRTHKTEEIGVYNVIFDGSEELLSWGYMDAIGLIDDLRDIEVKKVTTRQVQKTNMVAGQESAISTVIDGLQKKEWVGIGWVDHGEATSEDFKKYPFVVDE